MPYQALKEVAVSRASASGEPIPIACAEIVATDSGRPNPDWPKKGAAQKDKKPPTPLQSSGRKKAASVQENRCEKKSRLLQASTWGSNLPLDQSASKAGPVREA